MVKNNFVLINSPRQTCPAIVDTCAPTSEPRPPPVNWESNLISGRLCIQLRKRCTFVLLAVRDACSINSSSWLPGAQDASLFSVIIILQPETFCLGCCILAMPCLALVALVAGGNYQKPRRESDPGGVDGSCEPAYAGNCLVSFIKRKRRPQWAADAAQRARFRFRWCHGSGAGCRCNMAVQLSSGSRSGFRSATAPLRSNLNQKRIPTSSHSK